MASKPAELPLSSWAPPASPLRIEYSNEVMEEMRARATEGFYKLTRGGVEIAGLLLGSVHHDSIRVLAQLPFEIEYAYGPVFSLSPRDLAYVRKLIDDVSSSSLPDSLHGKGYRVLGLYISHSRSAMTLSEEESGLIDQLFPHNWQTVLILKPSRTSETAATFFVREPDGEMRANQPYGLFVVTPAMGERRARPAASPDASLIALADAASNAAAVKEASVPSPPSVPRAAPPSAEAPPTPAPPAPVSRVLPPPVPEQTAARTQVSAPSPSEEDLLARRALPEGKPVPPPVPSRAVTPPPQAAPRPPETEEEPASEVVRQPQPPKASDSATREIERLSLPRPLAALVVEPDPPMAAPSPAEAAPESPQDLPSQALDSPEWHEEEAVPRFRATPWLHWALPSIGLVLLLVLGYLVYHLLNGAPPTVMFFTRAVGESPEVIWQLKGLSDARSAVITIETDGETRRIDLIRAGRLSGAYKDPFLKGTSKVMLDIERASGEAIHRVATLVPADSVVDYLSGGLLPESIPAAAVEAGPSAVTNDAASGEPPRETPDLSLSVRGPEPILATPVEQAAGPSSSIATVQPNAAATPAIGAAPLEPPAARQEARQREGVTSAGLSRPQTALSTPPPPSPEAPVRARVTEAPVNARQEMPRPATVAQSNAMLRPEVRTNAGIAPAPPDPASPTAPTSVVRPAQSLPSVQQPPLVSAPAPNVNPPAPANPAPARVTAGRILWTGQLKKNQSLQINGKKASLGVLNGALPGIPVRVNALPGELTPQGLVVYTSNPRYKDLRNAVEPPGPTNGWNQTRYVFDPVRANSLVVIGSPSEANQWQGVSIQNGDKTASVIVMNWQVFEP
ncbi:MAG: hypothetical protein IT169_08575 [Bryobacterales bacterium]|nr:hypothetical protein [Bryobacterales bacterium]